MLLGAYVVDHQQGIAKNQNFECCVQFNVTLAIFLEKFWKIVKTRESDKFDSFM